MDLPCPDRPGSARPGWSCNCSRITRFLSPHPPQVPPIKSLLLYITVLSGSMGGNWQVGENAGFSCSAPLTASQIRRMQTERM